MKFAITSTLFALAAASDWSDNVARSLAYNEDFQAAVSRQLEHNLPTQNFDSLTIADKLKSIAKDLGTPEQLHSLWEHIQAMHPRESNQHLTQFNINYNLEIGSIDLTSAAVDP